ncbi:MAG TPA: lipopolysaccharide heptosyltransferase I [Epsilonproteobacteria bacterium]|nr:lipopolysaccharide heptosyltransferase I [Campylobacterota bacterium]
MKIAIVKLSALGDIVHAMVVLQFIKKQFPHYHIEWIVEECFAGLLEHNPDIDKVHTVNLKALKKNKKQFFAELRQLKAYAKNSYDVVIDMQGLLKSAIVSKILGKNVGFDKHSTREKIAALFYHQSFCVPYEKNVILRNVDLVSKALDFEATNQMIQEKKTFLFFTQNDTLKVEKYFKKEQANIVYILGSSWQSKVYPKEKFVEVIDGLEGQHLLVWGTEEEHAYAKYISQHTGATVVEKMDLNALKALVSEADLVIGADSGPTHFAWALNRPSITIFGPTPSARNVLETPINKVIDCGKKINPLKLDKEDTCIGDIDAKCIITLAKGLLA